MSLSASPLLREAANSLKAGYVYMNLASLSPSNDNLVEGSLSSGYATSDLLSNASSSSVRHALNESTSDQRFMRYVNPVFKYDFKVGNYMPDDAKKMNPHLFNTIKDVTTGIRKSA